MEFTKSFIVDGEPADLQFIEYFRADYAEVVIKVEGLGLPAFLEMNLDTRKLNFVGMVPEVLMQMEEELSDAIQSFYE